MAAAAAVTGSLLLTVGCSSSNSTSGTTGSGTSWATASSVAAGGGMNALVAAAKKEGTLNVITLPANWANYGTIMKDFTAKYGIKINDANPDGASQDEPNAVNQLKGQDRAPDVLDMGTAFAVKGAQQGILAPYKVATWASFGLRMRKIGAAERRQRAGDLLDMVGLAPQASQYPHQLSGGQQQRVALARALAIQPRVLLLAEPLSALDAKVRLQLRDQIRTLQQRLGTTTLFVTHDQEEALSMADRVGVMREGRLEQIAAPDELYTDPATAFVAEFVGVMNRIPGELQAGDQVAVLGSTIPVRGHRPVQSAVDVLVRPEGLRLEVVENGNGIVTTRTFLGSVTRVGVQLSGDVAVQVDRPSAEAAALAPGASVQVSLPAQPVLVAPCRVS